MIGNEFKSNSALNSSDVDITGQGGGLFYLCESAYKCTVDIKESNSFNDNYAADAGGGIKWNQLEPNFDGTTTFSGNYAALYGDDIACFA